MTLYINIKINRFIFTLAVLLIVLSGCLVMMSGNEANMPVSNHEVTPDGVELPIIMYHSVLKDKARHGKYVISPDELEKDLQYLEKNGYVTVTVNDLIMYTEGKTDLPQKPVMLTFDDGYYNNYLYVFPLLKKYNCKAVLSIIGKYTDQFSDEPDENAYYSHCTWDNLCEMSESGYVEMQNHSYNLHNSSGDRLGTRRKSGEGAEEYKKLLTEDIGSLQKRIKEKLSIKPTAFVYPFGAISEGEEEIIQSMGFECTMTCTEETNYITHDKHSLYSLGRYIRPSGKGLDKILK